MKTIKMLLLAGISGVISGCSTLAVPLGITFDGGVPLRYWGSGWAAGNSFQYLHIVSIVDEPRPGFVNGVGFNQILVKWDSEADWLYVLNPRPANVKRPAPQSETAYGQGSSDASRRHSPGPVSASSARRFASGVSGLAGIGSAALLFARLKLRPRRELRRPLVAPTVQKARGNAGTITVPSKPVPDTQPAWMDPRPPRRLRSRRARKNICSSRRWQSNAISQKRPSQA